MSALEDVEEHQEGEAHEHDQTRSNKADQHMPLPICQEFGGWVDLELLLLVDLSTRGRFVLFRQDLLFA